MERFATSLLGQAKVLLLATDGSHFSDGAVQEALFFGQACRARVVVLHVVYTAAESLKSANSILMQRQQEIAPHLEQIRAMARDSGVAIEVVTLGSSFPEQTIVEQARLRQADVILMGRHGKTGRLALLVGSMTAKVIGQGFPRVLVVPKDFLITGSHILLALDQSANSQLAAQEALSLGKTCTTLQQLTVVSIVKKEEEIPQAKKLAEEVCSQAKHEGLTIACEVVVLVGTPPDLIVEVARNLNVDMILIGAGGKSFLTRMGMGRVTEKVIGLAHCAVLVVTA